MSVLFSSTRTKKSEYRKSKSSNSDDEERQRKRTSYSLFPHRGQQEDTLPTAQTIPAWHVHGSPSPSNSPTRAGRRSTESASQPISSHSANHGLQTSTAAAAVKNVPNRNSSLRAKDRHEFRSRKKSGQRPELDRIDSEPAQLESTETMTYLADQAKSQLNRKPLPVSKDDDDISGRTRELSLHSHDIIGESQIGHSHGIQRPSYSALDDHRADHVYRKDLLKRDGSRIQTRVVEHNTEHLTLPEGFQLQNSSHTVVKTVVRPAVTQEVVRHDAKEIQQEVIIKDVHIHHYYTYIQPIKVTEILPAKHYVLDGVTGEKVEIPPPPGWQIPTSLQPHIPDMSDIKISTRHYLVNEEYPEGIAEAAPDESRPTSGEVGSSEIH